MNATTRTTHRETTASYSAPHRRTVSTRLKKRRRIWLVIGLVLLVSIPAVNALRSAQAKVAETAIPLLTAAPAAIEASAAGAASQSATDAGSVITAPTPASASATTPGTATATPDAAIAAADASTITPDATASIGSASATGNPVATGVASASLFGSGDPAAPGEAAVSDVSPTAGSPAASGEPDAAMADGFVHVADVIPDIRIDMKYFGSDNFMGRPADGYEANTAILTEKACEALARVQSSVGQEGLSLVIYDAYRPRRAVADFVRWASDPADQATKATYYPNLDKATILDGGYIAAKSSHSRGSTVDLSLVDTATGEVLDMGCPFDFFGKEADPDWTGASNDQAANRRKLRLAMEREGFVISAIEWWHFRLRNEPFPKTTFDFPVR